MIMRIEYKDGQDRVKHFIYDEEIYDTKEKIHYALNISDMGSVLEGCMSVYDSEYKLLKKAFEQQKEASTDSRKDNNEAD